LHKIIKEQNRNIVNGIRATRICSSQIRHKFQIKTKTWSPVLLPFRAIQSIDADCIIVKHGKLPFRAEGGHGGTVGGHKFRVTRPQFFDWEIGAKKAALWPKYGDSFVNDIGNMLGIIALDEGPKP